MQTINTSTSPAAVAAAREYYYKAMDWRRQYNATLFREAAVTLWLSEPEERLAADELGAARLANWNWS